MFQIIGRKRAVIRSPRPGPDHSHRLRLTRLSSIAVAFGCPGIVELSLSIGALVPPVAGTE
jgi:hypothetical protein